MLCLFSQLIQAILKLQLDNGRSKAETTYCKRIQIEFAENRYNTHVLCIFNFLSQLFSLTHKTTCYGRDWTRMKKTATLEPILNNRYVKHWIVYHIVLKKSIS